VLFYLVTASVTDSVTEALAKVTFLPLTSYILLPASVTEALAKVTSVSITEGDQ